MDGHNSYHSLLSKVQTSSSSSSPSFTSSSNNFDWSQLSNLLTSSNTKIPTDVTFKVVDEQDELLTKLEAHKMIVALHSDHFKNAFYGSGTKFKEGNEGVIVIKETTKEAFEDFLGFLYEEKVDFAKKSLRKLFDILNLGERYQVQELKDRISQLIENFPLTTANVVEVAAIAEEFSHFESSSRALFSNCVAFIEKQCLSGHGVLKFVRENEDKVTATKLLQRVKFVDCTRDVKNTEPVANNRTPRPAWQHGNTIMQRILFFIFIDYFDIFICLFFSLTYALKGCIADDPN